MKKLLLIFVFAAFFCSAIAQPVPTRTDARNAATGRPVPKITSVQNAAIDVAIADFLKCRLSKRGDVFSVWLYGKGEYDRYETPDDLFTISILADQALAGPPFPITETDTLGSTKLPTRHVIKNGKLFYWYDPDYGLTQEMIDVLFEYNLAEYLSDSSDSALMFFVISRMYTDDALKGADYYFCKDDSRKYKRIINRAAISWYKPPKVRCKSVK